LKSIEGLLYFGAALIKRYSEISNFLFDLHHPNEVFHNETRSPLLERDPMVF
jgi:hypothetical protein